MILPYVNDIQLLSPEWDDIIILKVNYKNLSRFQRQELARTVMENAKSVFPNNKIIVIDSNGIEISTESVLDF